MIRRLWQIWRERLRRIAGGAPPDAEPVSASEGIPPDSEPWSTGEPERVGVLTLKGRARLGVLRPVNRVLPIRVSRAEPITRSSTPIPMQNVPTLPLPLVKPHVIEMTTDEAALEERQIAKEEAAANAAWEALWALRGTRSTAAQPVSVSPKSVDKETVDREAREGIGALAAEARPDELLNARQSAATEPAARQPAVPKPALSRVKAVVRPPESARSVTAQGPAPSSVSARGVMPEPTQTEKPSLPAARPLRTLARRQTDVSARLQARRKPAAPPTAQPGPSVRQIVREASRRAARQSASSVGRPRVQRRPAITVPPATPQARPETERASGAPSRPTNPLLAALRTGLERLGLSRPKTDWLQPIPTRAVRPETGRLAGEPVRGIEEQQPDLGTHRRLSLPKPTSQLEPTLLRFRQAKPKRRWLSLPKPTTTPIETDKESPAPPITSPTVRQWPGKPSAVEGWPPQPPKRPIARREAARMLPSGQSRQPEPTAERPIASRPTAMSKRPAAAVEGLPTEKTPAGLVGASVERPDALPEANISSPTLPAASTTATVRWTIRDRQDLAQLVRPTIVSATLQSATVQRVAETTLSAQPEAGVRPPAEFRPADERVRAQVYDLEAVSRQVYQIIRHRLTVECERERGW